ncbi:unnamed protein product [Lasius platythorax]|uniref:Uncharacterized protein n=1 Tax=Lasius platythorax TaxID=488582 RepID=A0AAV2NP95_9HYME
MPKDVRYLCKRRKNQLINYELNCHENSCSFQSIVRNVALSPVYEAIDESVHEAVNVALPKDVNGLDALLESQSHVESKEHINKEHHIESQNDTPVPLEDVTDCMDETTLRIDLQRLIMENNISHNTVNELLLILRKHGHVELPSDVRVLLQTPRNASVNF